MEDEFESLREKTTRTSNVYEDMELEEEQVTTGGGFMGQLSPSQRFILAFLLFLNVVALVCGLLVMTNTVRLW